MGLVLFEARMSKACASDDQSPIKPFGVLAISADAGARPLVEAGAS
jgi:hypothetical protein